MRLLVLIPFCLVVALPARAQEREIDIFGYFEPQYTLQRFDGDFAQIQRNKFRVDLSSDINDRVSLKMNYNLITYHGTTELDYLFFLPEPVVSTIPEASRSLYRFTTPDENFLDNAHMKLGFDRFDLTIGKQQIAVGTGYAWNPTDLFNTKDIFDPTYEVTGHNAYRIDIPLPSSVNIMVLFSPDNDFSRSGKYARMKKSIGHFDVSFLYGERHWNLTDFTTFTLTEQNRTMTGGDFAGELFGLGVWGEAAYNTMGSSKDYLESITGFDYTFSSGLYFLNEYYHNGQGSNDYRDYTLNDWLRSFIAETKSVCQNQVFSYISYPATELLTIGNSSIACVSDGSIVFIPYLEYNFEQNIDITFFGSLFAGSEGKAYAQNLGNGGILRMRYYY